ncbi:MAG TPA: cytochrome c oxidase assembly protein [Pseudonocardia sp.]|jgi:putative copper resistance protein D
MVGKPEQRAPARGAGLWPLVLAGSLLAAVVAVGLTLVSGSRPLASLGLPDPGALTSCGLPVVRALTEIASVLTVGSVLLASLLAPPAGLGYLDVVGYRALRAASYTAATWAVGAVLMVPLTVADSLGQPVTGVLGFTQLLSLVPRLDTAAAWALTALVAVLVFAAARVVLSWRGAVGLLGLAVAGLLPVASTGHSSAGGAHDLATDSLMLHVVAAALWVGGLVALLGLVVQPGESSDRLPVAVRRFSALALVCWLVMAGSGVLNALVRIGLPDLVGSYYGALLLAKTAALLLLGLCGYRQRRGAVDAVAAGRRGALLGLGAVEVLIMLGTIGLAVALSHSAPPVRGVRTPSRTAVEIGYDLAGSPTLARLALDWRFAVVLGSVGLLAAGLYLVGARRLAGWPARRTASWLAGCAVVVLATCSGIGRYAPVAPSAQLIQFGLLAVVAPLLLVLGAPVRLTGDAWPSKPDGEPPSVGQLVRGVLAGPLPRRLSHPLVAVIVLVGGSYLVYLTGLFDDPRRDHAWQLLAQVCFLAAGTLFFAGVLAGGPAGRATSWVRIAALVLAIGLYGRFGAALLTAAQPIGQRFTRGLGLPWATDLLADQRAGAAVLLVLVQTSMVVALVLVLVSVRRGPTTTGTGAIPAEDSNLSPTGRA